MTIVHYRDSDFSGERECKAISRTVLSLIRKTTFFVRKYENYNAPSHAHHYMGIQCGNPYPPPWNARLVADAMLNPLCEISPALPIVVAPVSAIDKHNLPTIVITEKMQANEGDREPFYELRFSTNDEMFKWMKDNMTSQVVDNIDLCAELEKKTSKHGAYFNWNKFKVCFGRLT